MIWIVAALLGGAERAPRQPSFKARAIMLAVVFLTSALLWGGVSLATGGKP